MALLAAAAAAPNSIAANGAHSSDDEFSEPPPAEAAPATCPALELLEAKLRSYLNLKAKLHGGTGEDEVMRSLAAQVRDIVYWVTKALLSYFGCVAVFG